jgi:2-iminobutanoate/2-iminopropanoate deaminase
VHRELSPEGLAPPASNYAHAVVSDGPTRWLHTAGVVATRSDGSVPADLAEQARTVWHNIGVLLDDAGLVVTDIVSITTYVVQGNDLQLVMAARDQALGGHRAASTLLVVPALARPEWQVEIAVVACA